MGIESWKNKVWLPGVATLALAAISFIVTFRYLVVPHAVANVLPGTIYIKGTFFHFNVPWMLTLPFVGAFGALLARRQGANRGERALAALFPSLFWVATIVSITLPVLVQNALGAHFFEAPPTAQALVTIGIPLVIGSAVASLFGAALVGVMGTDRNETFHA